MASKAHEAGEEEQTFLPKASSSDDVSTDFGSEIRGRAASNSRKRGIVWWLRLVLELAMAGTIVYLLVAKPLVASRGTLRRTPVPEFPRKIYTFRSDPKYVHGDMWFNETDTLRTLHNWIELSSDSRGYVVVDDASRYDLPEPYEVALDRWNDGPGYMMTVFHQLHCLSYVAEHWQRGYAGINLTEEVAHHTAHCFNYLRQGIMCSADTTLEGKTEAGPGEGSEHECKDYDAVLEWANEHSAMKWRNALLPDTSIL
ncbi:hypothetical protein C7999DRAFT_38393 [Corynascus novoguineensis]|uniref:Oxidase ustYa n=1 Tax=Corynascus novoguineensis TaxID=1126955 RepID=A0AAN7HT57_9PEZI|nr:hypothetical protein C7999DRAFT_38393 [Corynascus novoguineensis]